MIATRSLTHTGMTQPARDFCWFVFLYKLAPGNCAWLVLPASLRAALPLLANVTTYARPPTARQYFFRIFKKFSAANAKGSIPNISGLGE